MFFSLFSYTASKRKRFAQNTLNPLPTLSLMAGVLLFLSFSAQAQTSLLQSKPDSDKLALHKAISLALANDEWLQKSKLLESSLMQLSEGAGSLPDPTFSIGVLNLPTDGFAFNQEPMTQLKVGASQLFPRGDSLALEEKRYQLSAQEQPYLRENRRRKVALQTSLLWLQAYEASASYRLVNEARPLFDKLKDIISASYASSAGKASQQDIIRAELELVRLNDRLISLKTQQRVALSKLAQFLFSQNVQSLRIADAHDGEVMLPTTLPQLSNTDTGSLTLVTNTAPQQLYSLVSAHPLIAATEQRVRTQAVGIDIAEQAYKPQYGVNTSYALRNDAPEGQSRADFFSVGLSVSVPLFSHARQDANVASAKLMTEAIRTEKLLLMRELTAGLKSSYDDYIGESERLDVYQNQIIPQMTQQSDASLNAYTNDTGDFAEVVRAKIAELDAHLTLINIKVRRRVAIANLQYFLSEAANTAGVDHE